MEIQNPANKNVFLSERQKPLADEQKDKLREVLSTYRPENFSSQDRCALMKELGEAGIPRSLETAKMIESMGYKVSEPHSNSGISNYSDKEDDPLITPQIILLFKQHSSGDISEEEFHSRMSQLEKSLSKSTGKLINKST